MIVHYSFVFENKDDIILRYYPYIESLMLRSHSYIDHYERTIKTQSKRGGFLRQQAVIFYLQVRIANFLKDKNIS